jgi:hypothetical protein
MTFFEYLSVAVSVVLSLSASQILANIRAVFHPQRRYWVHALWVVLLLYFHIAIWWRFWTFRDFDSWNLGVFGLVLLGPGLLVICSSTLVLSQQTDETSWEQHFFSVRAWFFVALGFVFVLGRVLFSFLLSVSLLDPSQYYGTLLVLVCAAGALSDSKRVHSALVLVSLVGAILSALFPWFEPARLLPSR